VIPGMENNFKELIAQYGINKVEIVHGGKTRQESVYNCLQRVTSERVIIHEAARPFVTQEFIKTLMEKELIAAVVPIVPIKETTVSFDTVGAGKYPPDSCLVQLPQVFLTEPLKTAHKTAAAVKQRCTDDSSLLYSYLNDYNAIRYTHGLEQNIKITTPLDLLYAEVLHREGYCGCHRSK
jgi:2-C-methyl-D-erythritol 4-phosphate cytidylyltransferase